MTLGLVEGLTVEEGHVAFTLQFTGEQPPLARAEIHSRARKAVQALPGVADVKAGIASRAAAAQGAGHGHAHGAGKAAPEELIPEVKHTIAVSSGKGGVGKSTVAVNLALGAPRGGRRGRDRGRGRLRPQRPADDRGARPSGDGREPHRAGRRPTA